MALDQILACCLKPAKGNQDGTYFTGSFIRNQNRGRKRSLRLTYRKSINKKHARLSHVAKDTSQVRQDVDKLHLWAEKCQNFNFISWAEGTLTLSSGEWILIPCKVPSTIFETVLHWFIMRIVVDTDVSSE